MSLSYNYVMYTCCDRYIFLYYVIIVYRHAVNVAYSVDGTVQYAVQRTITQYDVLQLYTAQQSSAVCSTQRLAQQL